MDVLRLPSPPRASPAELSVPRCCSLSSLAANSCPAWAKPRRGRSAESSIVTVLRAQRTVVCSRVILPGEEQMQLKGCYQRRPRPRAKHKYPNATPSDSLPPSLPSIPTPSLLPLAKLPHFNPIVCTELREMIFRRQWVPCREKKRREGGLECVSEVASTPLLMGSN